MKKQLSYFITLLILTFWSISPSFAQEDSGSYFDIGVKTGSFLPSKITGVSDLLPIWGVKLGHPVSDTLIFEYDFDFAHAKGVEYLNGYFSFRHNFDIGNTLPLFFLIGVDLHYYKRKDAVGSITGNITEFDRKFASGWHLGVGGETLIYGDFYGRADIRMGFSPGRQLTATLGLVLRL